MVLMPHSSKSIRADVETLTGSVFERGSNRRQVKCVETCIRVEWRGDGGIGILTINRAASVTLG